MPMVPLPNDAAGWSRGCIAPVPAQRSDVESTSLEDVAHPYARGRPRFATTEYERLALQAYRTSQPGRQAGRYSPVPAETTDWLDTHSCLQCHPFGAVGGWDETIREVIQKHPELAPRASHLRVPPLTRSGFKLRRDALLQAVRGRGRFRDYLDVHMPHFRFGGNIEARIDRWIAQDRWMERPDALPPFAESRWETTVGEHVGRRLVGSQGFGCTSCHTVGPVEPKMEGDKSRGPQLVAIGRRIRPIWFSRWLDNPARYNRRVEMPSVRIAVPGVLNDHLPSQRESLWRALQNTDFVPPDPNAFRVLRHSGRSDTKNGPRAHTLTDIVRAGDRIFVKPLVIGFAHRHNVLFDFEQCECALWWVGDTASLYSRGKTWRWELPQRAPRSSGTCQFRLTPISPRAERKPFIVPARRGQFITEPDSWRHDGSDIVLEYHLEFQLTSSRPSVAVRERFSPSPPDDGFSGWNRTVEVDAVPAGWELQDAAVGCARAVRIDQRTGSGLGRDSGGWGLVAGWSVDNAPFVARHLSGSRRSRHTSCVAGSRTCSHTATRRLGSRLVSWQIELRFPIHSCPSHWPGIIAVV